MENRRCSGDVSRRLAVSQRQSGTADRHSELPCRISPNKPDFPAAVPRQICLQQGVRANSLVGGAAAHLGAGVSVRGTGTMGHHDRPWHHFGQVRNNLGGLAVSSAVFQRFTCRCRCRSIDGADQVFSGTFSFVAYRQENVKR